MSARAVAGLPVVALVVVGVIAAEQQSPGITLLAVAVVAEVAQRIVSAAVWPLGAGALVWAGHRWGRPEGRRDAMAEVARAEADRQERLRAAHGLRRIGGER